VINGQTGERVDNRARPSSPLKFFRIVSLNTISMYCVLDALAIPEIV
jgi:hypothetical protein